MLSSFDFKILFKNKELSAVLFSDEPVLYMSWSELVNATQDFQQHFPGITLYAVKCNPHPAVIKALVKIGITHFDTASLAEIQLIKSILPTAKCYFNHPIKKRRAISCAYFKYGVRDFVIDSQEELDKLCSEINIQNITVQVRLTTISGSKSYDFSQKFGITPDKACTLVNELVSRGINWALSFHVGSQCEDPSSFTNALMLCQKIIEKIDVKPQYINVGGGFPGHYPNSNAPCLHKYFEEIKKTKNVLSLPSLLCEPGRALVCHAGALIVQILARKHDKLYINDGVYGALGEINYAKLNLKTIALSLHRKLSNKYSKFSIFGPTCDSFDTLENQFNLPDNVDEGDWIVIFDLGAYSTALSNHFNGFTSNNVFLN